MNCREVSVQSGSNSPPYVVVSWFGLRQYSHCKHIDIYADDIFVRWSPGQQLVVLRVARTITCAVWEMLLDIRSAVSDSHPSIKTFPGTPDYSDVGAFLEAAKRFPKLIAGGGSVLQRLYATNIVVECTFSESTSSPPDAPISLTVSHFIAPELPEAFIFQNVVVSILQHEVLSIKSFALSHCIENEKTVISGRKLLDLRTRKWFCCDREDSPINMESVYAQMDSQTDAEALKKLLECGRDGFKIEIDGVDVHIPHKLNFGTIFEPIVLTSSAAAKAFLAQHGSWTPESNPRFRELFWRPPPLPHDASYDVLLVSHHCDTKQTAPNPDIWISLAEITLSILDDPMEAWLELCYPLWRREMEDKISRSLLATVTASKMSLAQQSSSAYIQSIDPIKSHLKCLLSKKYSFSDIHSPPILLILRLQHASLTICPTLDDHQKVRSVTSVFDSPNPSIIPNGIVFDAIAHVSISASVSNTTIHLRGQTAPIAKIKSIDLSGSSAVVLPATARRYYRSNTHTLDKFVVEFLQNKQLPKVFFVLNCHADASTIQFQPSSLYAMQECAAVTQRLLPESFTQTSTANLLWWDIVRSVLYTKMLVTLTDTQCHLLAPSKHNMDRLVVKVGFVELKYFEEVTTLNGVCTTIIIEPCSGHLPPLVEIPYMSSQVAVHWNAGSNKSNFYPFLLSREGDVEEEIGNDTIDAADFHSEGLILTLSLSVMNALPQQVSYTNSITGCPYKQTSKPQASSLTIFFDECIRQALRWGMVFSKLPPAPFPKKCVGTNLGFKALAEHVVAVRRITLAVDSFEVGFFDSDPLKTFTPTGVRLILSEKCVAKISLTKWKLHEDNDSQYPDPFKDGLILLPKTMWCIHDMNVETGTVNGRICTQNSGSRGRFLFSLESFKLNFKKASSEAKQRASVSSLQAIPLSPQRRVSIINTCDDDDDYGGEEERMIGMINLMEHKGQGEEGPASISVPFSSDLDSGMKRLPQKDEAFLIRIQVDGFKLLLTEETNEGLVRLGGHVATTTLELVTSTFKPPAIVKRYFSATTAESEKSRDIDLERLSTSPHRRHVSTDSGGSELSSAAFVSKQFENNKNEQTSRLSSASKDNMAARAGKMMKSIVFEVNEPQIQLVDSRNKGCLIFALKRANLQMRCGLMAGVTPCGKELQELIFRRANEWTEAVMSSVKDAQLHVAPADVDLGADVLWLPRSAFKVDSGSVIDNVREDGEFSLEKVMLEGESDLKQGNATRSRKYGIFLPVFVDTDEESPNSFEVDALIVHTNLMPAAVIRAEAAKFTFGCDQEQIKIISSVVGGFGRNKGTVPSARGENSGFGPQEEESVVPVAHSGTGSSDYVEEASIPEPPLVRHTDVVDRGETVAELWELRQELSWMARGLESDMISLSKYRSALLEPSEDADEWESALDEMLGDREKTLKTVKAQSEGLLLLMQNRVATFTLRTRVDEVRPDLQFHAMFPELTVELKVKPEDNTSEDELGRDPFLRIRVTELSSSIQSYAGGDLTTQLSLHNVKVDSFTRIHASAPLKEVTMFCGFTDEHEARLRAGSKFPVVYDEEGSIPMVSAVLVVGAPVQGVPVVRLFEVNVVPLVVSVSKGQITSLMRFVSSSKDLEKVERKEDKVVMKAKKNFLSEKRGGPKISFRGFVGGAGKLKKGVMKKVKKEKREKGGELTTAAGDAGKAARPDSRREEKNKRKKDGSAVAFHRLRLGEVNVFVSYKGESWANLEDFDDLHITLHSVLYLNRVTSVMGMVGLVRRRVVRDLLGQVTRNFENIGMFLAQKFRVGEVGCGGCGDVGATAEFEEDVDVEWNDVFSMGVEDDDFNPLRAGKAEGDTDRIVVDVNEEEKAQAISLLFRGGGSRKSKNAVKTFFFGKL